MSLSTSSGVFTQENGYYTVFADVRNNISGNAGVDFKKFWLQSGFWKNGAQTNPSSGNYVPTNEFTTTKIPLYLDGADALMRIKHVFTYDGVPTVTGVDTFDIDNDTNTTESVTLSLSRAENVYVVDATGKNVIVKNGSAGSFKNFAKLYAAGQVDVTMLDGTVYSNIANTVAQKYADHGYKLPRLVFWNVNSRTGTIPVKENDMGVALVSGFSVNIVKMVMSGKTDPYECLLETLNSDRYAPIEEALSDR
jgi:hypothetical protein